MDPQEPQIIELDPDHAPRVTAIILLICGVMGVGFLVVNLLFTGGDPYYAHDEEMEWIDPDNQRFDITPNLVRDRRNEDSDEEEQANSFAHRAKPKKAAATTNPFIKPFQPVTPAIPGVPTTQMLRP
jgi:hypothetical protein